MIETTIKEVDGVRFFDSARIRETDGTINGVPVHFIQWREVDRNPEIIKLLQNLGLHKVGEDYNCARDYFAQWPFPGIFFIINTFLLKCYWKTLRFLYNNACMFRKIPDNEMFSWKYFTPYCWYKGVRR